jgi:hypothetical protein
MDRQEAVTVIKEIFDKCRSTVGKSIKLLPPKNVDTFSKNFQIQIQIISDDDPSISCIRAVAENHHLSVKFGDGCCLLYKPHSDKKNREG